MTKEDTIHKHGYWYNKDSVHHVFDAPLCSAIISLYEGVETAVDIGCGDGSYVKTMNRQGMNCVGYDGNPNTNELTEGLCQVLDFAEPVDIGTFELVISLEVGEHIPKEYEQIFLDNVANASRRYIVLSWALPGQPGWGHFNCQDNDYIINELKSRNFWYNVKDSLYLRKKSEMWWFSDTILVFAKNIKL